MIRFEMAAANIGVVYLDNPPLNILTMEMTRQLIELFTRIEKDDKVRVVIISGTGEKIFCAGADIKEFVAVRDQVVQKKLSNENEAFLKIAQLPKPVIAAMGGMALGAGCEIALACDIRVIATGAGIGLPEIKLGVFPGSGGLYRLPGIVGRSKALEMMYTGDIMKAEDAFAIGLVNHIAPEGETLTLAMEIATKIARQPKHALAAIKNGVRKSFEMTLQEAIQFNLELSDQVFKTKDCEEGVAAFFEKRPAKFE